MTPVQVWLPLVGRSIGFADVSRDMRRALDAWEGQHQLWTVPEFDRKFRWRESWDDQPAFVMAIPGETLECLDVYHVGENGFAYGPPNFDRFPEGHVEGLLDAWLNWPVSKGIRWNPPAQITINVPAAEGDNIIKERRTFLAPFLPVSPSRAGGVALRSPATKAAPVFPAAELSRFFELKIGPLRLYASEGSGVHVVAEQNPSQHCPAGMLEAAAPLHGFFPAGVCLDALHHWVRMGSVVEQARIAPVAALQRARALASPYLDTGRTQRGWSWMMPAFYETNDWTTVIQRGATLGLNDVRGFEQLKNSVDWRTAMTEWIDIRRAWGPIGFFWSLLIDRLESADTIRACTQCGRPISGTKRRKFCTLKENPECYRQRRAGNRRNERQRHK